MGIPRLIGLLEPYASSVQYHATKPAGTDNDDADSSTRRVVIDGPGMAYHAYYLALARNAGAANAYVATPSYREVADVAMAWLTQLESYGLHIEAIFFDGFLPESKTDVRIKRLQTYVDQLSAFRKLHSTPQPVARVPAVTETLASTNLFDHRRAPARLTSLPATAFLVPAIIERLSSSRFSARTSVVPAEADVFCAQHVRQHGGIVLTGDSDLLAHDLGSDGSVMLFRDLQEVPADGDSARDLHAQRYHLAHIAARLGLPGHTLAPLAFSIQQDPHRPFTAHLRAAQEAGGFTTHPSYPSFLAEYTPSTPHHNPHHKSKPLDPRISEFLHQPPSPSSKPIPIYLPFLHDDPTRTSAWSPSTPLRHLTYSILHPDRPTAEVLRRGSRIAPIALPPPLRPSEIHTHLANLHASLAPWMGLHDIPAPQRYRAWALRAQLLLLVGGGGGGRVDPPPAVLLLRRLLAGAFTDPGTRWEAVHASAQVQGWLYSLRGLGQVVGWLGGEVEWLGGELRGWLEGMPGVEGLFCEDEEGVEVGEELVWAVLEGVDVGEMEGEREGKRKRKRKKKGKGRKGGAVDEEGEGVKRRKNGGNEEEEVTLGNNMFSVLMGMD